MGQRTKPWAVIIDDERTEYRSKTAAYAAVNPARDAGQAVRVEEWDSSRDEWAHYESHNIVGA
ncbi:hypothetical protein [Saccharothrix sp. HUAS TT1]|uniref:hypothetical protein n=1 Tax=unclassified Saccharothrix TaxID=2593673 RepID=UPI00345B8B66